MMYLCGLANNMTEVAHSMLACTRDGYPQFAITPRDITKLDEAFVTIGDDCFMGPNVNIYTACHSTNPAERATRREWSVEDGKHNTYKQP